MKNFSATQRIITITFIILLLCFIVSIVAVMRLAQDVEEVVSDTDTIEYMIEIKCELLDYETEFQSYDQIKPILDRSGLQSAPASPEMETKDIAVMIVPHTTALETTAKPIQVKKAPAPSTTASEPVSTTINGQEYSYIGKMKITGYTHEEGFKYGQVTASGIGCREGICALNNTRRKELGIKYGDSIYIKGLGTYQVYDCGCSYNTVDIWFWTNKEAYAITGYYEVYIVK